MAEIKDNYNQDGSQLSAANLGALQSAAMGQDPVLDSALKLANNVVTTPAETLSKVVDAADAGFVRAVADGTRYSSDYGDTLTAGRMTVSTAVASSLDAANAEFEKQLNFGKGRETVDGGDGQDYGFDYNLSTSQKYVYESIDNLQVAADSGYARLEAGSEAFASSMAKGTDAGVEIARVAAERQSELNGDAGFLLKAVSEAAGTNAAMTSPVETAAYAINDGVANTFVIGAEGVRQLAQEGYYSQFELANTLYENGGADGGQPRPSDQDPTPATTFQSEAMLLGDNLQGNFEATLANAQGAEPDEETGGGENGGGTTPPADETGPFEGGAETLDGTPVGEVYAATIGSNGGPESFSADGAMLDAAVAGGDKTGGDSEPAITGLAPVYENAVLAVDDNFFFMGNGIKADDMNGGQLVLMMGEDGISGSTGYPGESFGMLAGSYDGMGASISTGQALGPVIGAGAPLDAVA